MTAIKDAHLRVSVRFHVEGWESGQSELDRIIEYKVPREAWSLGYIVRTVRTALENGIRGLFWEDLPCPFCGRAGERRVRRIDNDPLHPPEVLFGCADCDVWLKGWDARERWNKRAP